MVAMAHGHPPAQARSYAIRDLELLDLYAATRPI